jgi:hypothetical protein
MKKLLVALLAVLAVATIPAAGASDAMKAIVASYLDIQAALAADKTDGVKTAAASIGEQASRMGAEGQAILKASKAVEGAADVKAARAAFGDLSDAVIAQAKAEGWKDLPEAKVAFCPMVNKSWIQKGDAIRNPYYGSSMLTCGSFQKR